MGSVPAREAFWLVERMGTGLYVKTGPGDLTDNVWHAHRFSNEREAFDYARLSQAPWAKDLRATEHLFINKLDAPQTIDVAQQPVGCGDPGCKDPGCTYGKEADYVHIDNVVYHLDDIEVDKAGKCAWTDVANALTHIKLCREPFHPAYAEIIRGALIDLIGSAYNAGFNEGMREHTTSRGGLSWSMQSKKYSVLLDKVLSLPSTHGEGSK